MDFDICRRPWHEKFSCKERALGGFPSGHTAEAVYTALLYGLRMGPRYAIPTGTIALIIAATFISCNRHYLSQIVAGAGLGTLFALSADKVIEKHLDKKIDLVFGMNNAGQPSVALSFRF